MKETLLFSLTAFLLAASTGAASPPAPTNVRVVYLPAEILVLWDPSSGADHYWIARGRLDRRWAPMPPVTAPRFRDPDFSSPIAGYYQIAAINATGESSDPVELFVDAAPPVYP